MSESSQAPGHCSIVIPVYNEEESLPVLWQELKEVFKMLNRPVEVIFVNDGSNDQSAQLLASFKSECPEIVSLMSFAKRLGQTRALKDGLAAVRGTVAVTLDADLQNDPRDIVALLKKLDEGFDVVCGWRKNRKDKALKSFLSQSGNSLQRLITGMPVHDISCTLRAYKTNCLKDISLQKEGRHRFIPMSLSLQGYQVGEIVAHHRQRRFGSSKYGHKRIFKVVIDFFQILKSQGK